MIYFGSGAEFSREHWIPKMKEDYFDKYIPTDQYGFSKYIMTKYAYLSNNIYNLRLFGVFGKYDDWRVRLIPNICYRAVVNSPIIINQNKCYDFLYINDLIKITEWFINNEVRHNVYNVCTGTTIDFKTLAEKIIKISSKKMSVNIRNKNPGAEYSGDNTLLMNELKVFKFTNIEESIRDLYDWFENNRSILKVTYN
jgi:GDP-L-fucose synthase